jgi:nucleotide-binding universal stress UspA family protein
VRQFEPAYINPEPLSVDELQDLRGWVSWLRHHEDGNALAAQVETVERLLASLDQERERHERDVRSITRIYHEGDEVWVELRRAAQAVVDALVTPSSTLDRLRKALDRLP